MYYETNIYTNIFVPNTSHFKGDNLQKEIKNDNIRVFDTTFLNENLIARTHISLI